MRRSELEGTPTRALVGATLGFGVGFAAVSLFGPTAKLLEDTMGLEPAQLGLLVAVPSATGSLLRIPFGAWVDTTGGRKPFVVLLVLSVLGMTGLLAVLTAVYPHGLTAAYYPLLLVLGMLAGCGIASFSVGIGQVSYWYPQARQGRALGTYAGLGNVAPGLFALLVPLSIETLGIQWTYAAWLAVLLAGIAAYVAMTRNAPYFQLRHAGVAAVDAQQRAQEHGQELFPRGGVREGLAAAARLGRTWALVFLYFTSFGGFLALTAWMPTYFNEHLSVSMGTAGALTMLYSVLASVVRVPGGFLTDRVGGERTAILFYGVMAAGAVVMAGAATVAGAVVGCLLLASGMGVANAAVFKMVPRHLSSVGGGAGAGWVGGVGASGGFVLPPLFGGFVELLGPAHGYSLSYITFAGLAAGCVLVTGLLSRRALRSPAVARGGMRVPAEPAAPERPQSQHSTNL